MRTLDEWLNQVAYHPATPETAQAFSDLRGAVKGLGERLWALVPDGPEKTLALRKFQEGLMWGNLAIAMLNPADHTADHVARQLPEDLSDEELTAEYTRRFREQTGIGVTKNLTGEPWSDPKHDVMGDVQAAAQKMEVQGYPKTVWSGPPGEELMPDQVEPLRQVSDVIEPPVASAALSPEQREQYTRGGQCTAPITLYDAEPGMQRAKCYYDVCVWTAGPMPAGAGNLQDLQLRHDTSQDALK